MLKFKKEVILAESITSFFEQYNRLIKQGYCIKDQAVFDMQIFMSIQTNYWKVELVFDPQQYIDIGIDNLAWEDIKILANALDVKNTSKKVMVKDIKAALGLKTSAWG